jgi:hypothetical protein
MKQRVESYHDLELRAAVHDTLDILPESIKAKQVQDHSAASVRGLAVLGSTRR